MQSKDAMDYRSVGVLDNAELGLDALLKWIGPTAEFIPAGAPGRSILDIGYFANVIDIGHGLGLALTTDGVGTKVMVAEMLNRYDTIGIDCVAMNVNDLICVGARPIAMLDYIAVERSDPLVLEEVGRGLHEGARQSGISIVGGEISQVREMIRGVSEGRGMDLVGMCVGLVPRDRVIQGSNVRPGDVVVGLASSGVHCNGLTLARRVLEREFSRYMPELGRTVGEELLVPTRIYVQQVLALLQQDVPIRALINMTSDGFLNLARIQTAVGFSIRDLPEPPAIFRILQERGDIENAEMYRVFNMGIGFCLIVPRDPGILNAVHATMHDFGLKSYEIGVVVEDPTRSVQLLAQRLVGRDERFVEIDAS